MQVQQEGGQFESHPALLLHHSGEFVEDAGVVVESESTIHLFGNTSRLFELTKTIDVQKFMRIKFYVDVNGDEEIERVGLCLHDTFPNGSYGDQDQCYTVATGGRFDIDLGQFFYNRKTSVAFVSFFMELPSSMSDNTVEASISAISILPGENTDIVDENGQCKDLNAKTVRDGEETSCLCMDGFVSSNGGKQQGLLDSCVSCLLSPFCGFEGDSCMTSDDCFRGSCQSGRCEPMWVS